jgi:transposase
MGGLDMAMRKKQEPAIKARVALEAIKGEKTAAQISSEYGVHPTQVIKA